jgi:chromosome segregation ATPase
LTAGASVRPAGDARGNAGWRRKIGRRLQEVGRRLRKISRRLREVGRRLREVGRRLRKVGRRRGEIERRRREVERRLRLVERGLRQVGLRLREVDRPGGQVAGLTTSAARCFVAAADHEGEPDQRRDSQHPPRHSRNRTSRYDGAGASE